MKLVPSGTDDTAAILDAYTKSGGRARWGFGSGTFYYNGPGLTGDCYNIEGDGPGASVIILGPNSRFLASPARINELYLAGLQFVGGLGAIKFSFTGVNVGNQYLVDHCRFLGYTQAAVGHCAIDMPYWKISRSIFYGADSKGTMGVALAGYTDQSSITDCEFLRNRVHIKAGLGGNNLILDKCDLVQFDKGAARAMIWIVPNPSWVNAGPGFLVTASKFGNENLDPSDYRILYADEAGGDDFTTRLPKLDASSAGYIAGHRVKNSTLIGATGNGPFVYSTTRNLRDYAYEPIIAGSPPSQMVQYRAVA